MQNITLSHRKCILTFSQFCMCPMSQTTIAGQKYISSYIHIHFFDTASQNINVVSKRIYTGTHKSLSCIFCSLHILSMKQL